MQYLNQYLNQPPGYGQKHIVNFSPEERRDIISKRVKQMRKEGKSIKKIQNNFAIDEKLVNKILKN